MKRSKSGLDHKHSAAIAWARYRRLMLWMTLAAAIAVAAALLWLSRQGAMPLHMVIATIAGVGFSVLLGTALMGLVFLSSGTGHDEEVDRGKDDEL